MAYAVESRDERARQVFHALEDDQAQPLRAVADEAPESSGYLSAFESKLGEWSFAYGVAWALTRVRDPFLSSRRVAEEAQAIAAEAWRARPDAASSAVTEAAGRREPPKDEPAAQLDQFMNRLGGVRTRRGQREPGG
jgi:hypothetical protein